jgi:hypothetical protein
MKKHVLTIIILIAAGTLTGKAALARAEVRIEATTPVAEIRI